MSAAVRLLLGFHAHQPVGNFTSVIDDAWQRCYGRFLEIAERHPRVRFSLHVSGWLLGYLAQTYPAGVARITRMLARGQIEVLGGGDTEPVLAAIPDIDRREQLRAMTARVSALFGVQPRGAWLAERVWETTVLPALADCGIDYVAVDDYHFLSAGRTLDELTGYFTTEEDGRRLDLFPISESLRYMIPFTPAAEVVAAIEASPAAAIYFDDLEKFGIWPDTFEWVYGRGWLEAFFTQIEASQHIETQTLGQFHASTPSSGLVYLPTTSYAEMGEWTLSAWAARRLRGLTERSQVAGTHEQDRSYLRGGTWKNFLTKYPEANWMHKRVLGASARFHGLPTERQTDPMRAALHRAQANDAYWHGMFGGIYLPFLRRSVYANLAELDAELDRERARPASATEDIDLDGRPEIALRAGRFYAVLRPRDGGVVCELTDYGFGVDLADVLARRDEEYHDDIRTILGGGIVRPRPKRSDEPDRSILSIHERVAFVDRIEAADLELDRMPRGLFVDSWHQGPDGEAHPIEYDGEARAGDAAALCVARLDGLDVEKVYRVEGDAVTIGYALRASQLVSGVLRVGIDLAMPSAEGPGGSYLIEGDVRGGFATALHVPAAGELTLADTVLGGSVALHFEPAGELAARPLYTVSRSELGFEKIMQAAGISLAWPVSLEPGQHAERTIRLRCITATS